MTNDSSVKNEKNDDAISFLGALFANVQGGWVNLLSINGANRKENRTRWFDLSAKNTPQSLQQAAERASAGGWDAYISICPAAQRGADGARITRANAAFIPAYFIDIDVGKQGCPTSIDEAQKALEVLPFPPNMRVCSGNGIHAYWLLQAPLELNDETRTQAAARLRGFANAVSAAMSFQGLDVHASEPARVLRIPGTCNHKNPAAPRPVFLLPSSGECYSASDLDAWAKEQETPATSEKATPEAQKQPTSTGALSDARVLDLAGRGKNGALFTHLMNGVTSDYGGDQSRADMELCGLLAFYTGCDAAQMDRLFRQSLLCRDKWDEKRGATTYGEKTIAEAIKNCSVCYSPRNAKYDPERHADGDPLEKFVRAYEAVPPYFVSEHGELCYLKKDRDEEIAIKLASFACLIDEERKLDNGQDEPVLQFHIQGRAAGRVLPPFSIGAREFQAMGWPLEKWGTRANVVPGQAVKDKLRYAIGEASGALVRRVNVYTHTGFRKIGGAWAYLYHGDAIGAEDVQVDLSGDGLEAFSLAVVNGLSREEALKGSLSLRGCMADRVALPLLAYAYLAPLCSFLIDSACAPAFTVFLKGRTQTRKTTAAVLCQQHFGSAFNARRLPASFEDTLNSIREKAFALKDAVLLVDDAHPVSSQKERDKLADTINALASAWGERKGRGRCGADGRNTQARPPRGLGLLTGEDLPGTNESALSRFFVVEVGEGDVPKGDALTAAQEKGAGGVFCQAMRGYIEWLAGQGDSLLKTLGGLFDAYRKEAMRRGGLRDRLYEAVAQLRTGIEMLARYGAAVGALTDGESDKLRAAALACFYELATAQTADIAQESPSVLFIEALRDLLGNRTNTLCAIGSPGGARAFVGESFIPNSLDIGYRDESTAYLNPGQAYAAVQEYFRRQGRTFPLSKGTLFKRLADEGLCQVNPGKTGADYYAWPKNCGGRSVRVVRIPLKSVLPAETPENDEQMEWERIS